jgi:fructose-1,6-bisphosphatase II
MQGRLAPGNADELDRALEAGHDLEKKLELSDMVWGERVIFVLSGVTDGLLVRGIEDTPEGLEIQSFLLDSELDEGHILDVRVEHEK